MLGRFFDEHSGGQFVKTLLIIMLLTATVVQPFSLIYTAFGENLPKNWWEWTPATATFLFIALDWTILPLAFFFATTGKVSLKIVLTLMLAIVAFGAFDGYFVTTERMIAMRMSGITKHNLLVEHAKSELAAAQAERDKLLQQQENDRAHRQKQRDTYANQVAELDRQIMQAQQSLGTASAKHEQLMKEIKDGCLKVPYRCLDIQQEKERQRYEEERKGLQDQLAMLNKQKVPLQEQTQALGEKDDEKAKTANAAVAEKQEALKKVQIDFDAAVLDSQVYRWAGAWFRLPPRKVSTEQANVILDTFAAAVALGYITAQVMLAIAYYGRNRKGVIEAVGGSVQVRRAIRAYFARLRRKVYRTRIKELPVPVAERTRIVYVPVNPGGPVPPAEEFVTKPVVPAANEDEAKSEAKVAND